MNTLENYTALLTTVCQCYEYNEETGEDEPAKNCLDCGDWMIEGANETITQWQLRNNLPDSVIIRGAGMGWRKLSGYKVLKSHNSDILKDDIINGLTLNGDFTLDLELIGKQLTARRASHDEPMGASFIIEPLETCQGWGECLAFEDLKELDGQQFCPWCLDIELANR